MVKITNRLTFQSSELNLCKRERKLIQNLIKEIDIVNELKTKTLELNKEDRKIIQLLQKKFDRLLTQC